MFGANATLVDELPERSLRLGTMASIGQAQHVWCRVYGYIHLGHAEELSGGGHGRQGFLRSSQVQ